MQQWMSRSGTSLQMHSDQGTNFTTSVFKVLCQLLGVEKTATTPLHLQSNEIIKSFKQSILNNLSLRSIAKVFSAREQLKILRPLPVCQNAVGKGKRNFKIFAPLGAAQIPLPCSPLATPCSLSLF